MTFSFINSMVDHKTTKFQLEKEGTPLTYKDVIDLLIHSHEFKAQLTTELKGLQVDGFFWEVKPINQAQIGDPFEFVVVSGKRIANLVANPSSFQTHFKANSDVVVFDNLGGDAKLVVPTPINPDTNYAHLAAFLSTGTPEQQQSFWTQVGLQYQLLLKEETLWLSTAGMGVPWLHVRFDKRPKYYRHKPYKLV